MATQVGVSDPEEPAQHRAHWLRPAEKIDGKYENPIPTQVGTLGLIFKAMPLYIKNHEQRTPLVEPGPFVTDPDTYSLAPVSGLRVTWFGHSGMLLEIDGLRVLIDPVWEERASPRQWFGPRRFFPPTLALQNLPQLDVVLISHDHYDHMGEATIRSLSQQPNAAAARWVTSAGVGDLLRAWGVPHDAITELNWTASVDIRGSSGEQLTITAMPARHFSGRSLFHRFETLWSAFVLQGGRHRVYFGADTGLWEGFSEIAKFGPFDLTMLEIGAFNELWKDIHLGPDNALRAFRAMGGTGLLMPIHWGLFDLALHAWTQPIERLLELVNGSKVSLWSPRPGRPTEVQPGVSVLDPWWRLQP